MIRNDAEGTIDSIDLPHDKKLAREAYENISLFLKERGYKISGSHISVASLSDNTKYYVH